ncbi:MAG: ATP-binding protein [Syntrophothermus sp.]
MFAQLLNSLKVNKLFENVKDSDLNFHVPVENLMEKKKGEIIYKEANSGDSVFCLINGDVAIDKTHMLGKPRKEIVEAGDFFGEEDYLEFMPRTSTAYALSDCTLVRLDSELLNTLITNSEQFSANLRRTPLYEEPSFTAAPQPDPFSDFPAVNPADNAAESSFAEEKSFEDYNHYFTDNKPEADDPFASPEPEEKDASAYINNPDFKPSDDFAAPGAFPGSEDFPAAPGNFENPYKEKVFDEYNFDASSDENGFEDSAVKDEPDVHDFNTGDLTKNMDLDDLPDFNFKRVSPLPAAEEPVVPADDDSTEDDELSSDNLKLIMKAAQLVNSNIKIDDLLQAIVDAARSLTAADRGTLYLVDREKDELWSKVIDGNNISEIRLKIGEGIAGWTALNREVVSIADVQSDSRFKSSVDRSSGFITKNMLCFPIINKSDEVVGVLQLLNSGRGRFTKKDEALLSMLSVNAALALENAGLVERLLQSERVTSLGKMANFLIQDIKKPVLVSKRYTEHLKTKNLTPDVVQVLDMLLEQLNHVADLVQTTSSYSEGKTVLHSVVCKVNETLEAVFDKLASNIRIRNCEIIKKYDKDVTVKLDRKEFYQCCMHIIRNACDAMPEGGQITVTTVNKKSGVEISFKDNGIGIPDSIKDKIFEPFMSHGKTEGTGLGLSITKKIVEDHGGTITVDSDLGEGATFTITLPAANN